jgi:hypothetical protein
MKRIYWIAGISLLTVAALSAGQLWRVQAQSNIDFQGSYLAVLSDADMEASAYIDGQLGDRTPEMQDTLTLIPLDGGEPTKTSLIKLPVSNSVMTWPSNLGFTSDGQYALVTETYRPTPEGATERSQIPPGQQLFVIDLSNSQQPRVIDQINLGTRLMTVAVHPEGNLLAVSLEEPRRQIALVPFTNSQLGTPTFHGHPNLGEPEVHTPHVEWHPSGRFLRVTLPFRNETIFYAVDRTNAAQPRL